MQQPENEHTSTPQSDDVNEKRNMICFWIVGLCNTYGSTVLLSAAYDIIKRLNGASVRIDLKSMQQSLEQIHLNQITNLFH